MYDFMHGKHVVSANHHNNQLHWKADSWYRERQPGTVKTRSQDHQLSAWQRNNTEISCKVCMQEGGFVVNKQRTVVVGGTLKKNTVQIYRLVPPNSWCIDQNVSYDFVNKHPNLRFSRTHRQNGTQIRVHLHQAMDQCECRQSGITPWWPGPLFRLPSPRIMWLRSVGHVNVTMFKQGSGSLSCKSIVQCLQCLPRLLSASQE